jgi:histidine triad (HIT) family protein
MPTDPDCVFCKIIQGQLPSAKVLETASAVAFLDIQPLAPGHLLLVPKEHYATLLDMPAREVGDLTAEIPRLARATLRAVAAPAVTVTSNNGNEAGQEVAHVHFHVIPRHRADGVQIEGARVAQSDEQQQSIRNRIMEALELT